MSIRFNARNYHLAIEKKCRARVIAFSVAPDNGVPREHVGVMNHGKHVVSIGQYPREHVVSIGHGRREGHDCEDEVLAHVRVVE